MIAIHRIAVDIDPNNVVITALPKDAVVLHFEKSDRYYIHVLAQDNEQATFMRRLVVAEISTKGIQPSELLDKTSGVQAQYIGFAGRFHAWLLDS